MTARSAPALHGCLASPANGFWFRNPKIQWRSVSRDLRAVPGTPNLDMPVHSEGIFPRFTEALPSGGIIFFISPLIFGVLTVYLSLVVFVMVAMRDRNLHTS